MGRKNKAHRSAKQKSKKKEPANKPEIRIKGAVAAKTEKRTSAQNNSTVVVKSPQNVNKSGNHEKSASDVVGTVAGIVGGTMAGALISPVGMIFWGPVGGIIIGAGAAGLFGVAIQEILSKHVQQIEWLLCGLGILILPILMYLFSSGTATFEYFPDEAMPRRFVHVE